MTAVKIRAAQRPTHAKRGRGWGTRPLVGRFRAKDEDCFPIYCAPIGVTVIATLHLGGVIYREEA